MPRYMLLCSRPRLRSHDAGRNPDSRRQVRAWRTNLNAPGEKLCDGTARFLRKSSGKIAVSDGPFVETKEMVAGYFMIEANDYDHAVELTRDCPHLEFGPIEIRQVDQV